jgi:hypothetical protein
MRKTASISLVALLCAALAAAAPQGEESPAAKQQRVIELVRKLEQAPLDEALQREGDRAIQTVLSIPGGEMKICAKAFTEFNQEKPEYKYRSRFINQLMLASAAFMFEHPDQAGDAMADYTASMESALKVYSAIRKSKPDTRSMALDKLARTRAEGKLASYVRQVCGPEQRVSEVLAPVPQKPEEKHSTAEDRQRLVAIAHKLEAAPLDSAMGPDREWAAQWVLSAPDVHVRTCPTLLAELRRPRYKYRSELSSQLMISSAAFIIEHPEQGDSVAVQNAGGMAGVLKAYSAILKADPEAAQRSLDEYLRKQAEGKLAETVQDAVQDCK